MVPTKLLLEKSRRRLTLTDGGRTLLTAKVALGREPIGAKRAEGDGKTPEGLYYLCLCKEHGKYGRSLGLSYPNAEDAQLAFAEGRIDAPTLHAVEAAIAEHRRPPWGSPLGGEIYLHEGDTDRDRTQGCAALAPCDMAVIFEQRDFIDTVEIVP